MPEVAEDGEVRQSVQAVQAAVEIHLVVAVLEMAVMELLIQVVALVVQQSLEQAVQAAPALLSSSTPYHHKLYSCSKALPLGNARQV
jgi:hypothetical protein